jgi:outer membrane protein insertion porin family
LPFWQSARRIASAMSLCFVLASAAAAAIAEDAKDGSSASRGYLFSASYDYTSGKDVIEDHSFSQAQQGATQQQTIIERIDFIGNRRVRSDTLKARIFSRDGDPYNEETLRRDFQALWNTQFFEDVKLRVEDSPTRANAKVIVFEVKERPQIRRIRYEGIHSISESDILDRFKERKVGLSVESQFDPTRIKKAEVVLKDLLGEHGRQFARVNPMYERIASSNAVILVFKIEEGPKVKVGKIKFKGNHAFSDRKLIRAMRHDRPYAIPLYFWYIPVLTKTYDRQKLSEDLEVGVRGLYRDNGYFKVSVGEPILENIDTNGYRLGVPLILGRSQGKAVNITIPIEEGERYRMGTLKIVSADPDKALSLKVDALKSAFPLKTGDIFSTEKVRKALETYGKIYGEYGFIDFTPEPDTELDEEKKIVNLTMKFDEQKQYFVHRIDFSGNTTTRDKVIRRELMIDEGQLFNKRLWELSVLRLNQLDYFDKIEADKAAEIKRNSKEGTVDINLKLKEKGKQSIGLQGGVSGLAGSFIGLTYQTNNFLGFVFSFTEPYLFDRPISTGFSIFSSRYQFDQARQAAIAYGQSVSINPQFIQNYNQDSTGFTFSASYPMRKLSFTRVGVQYGLTHTNITAFNDASKFLFTQLQFRSIAGPSALKGIVSSTITPSISFNTVNNPMNPTGGKSYYYALSFSGGPLGGNVKSVSNVFDWKYFHPINKRRNVLSFHATGAYITGFGGGEPPPYSRFYMGGESDIRGYDIRSITPVTFIPIATTQQFTYNCNTCLNGAGQPTPRTFSLPVLAYTITFPGGDVQSYGNFEYRIPIVGSFVTAALFFDGGTNGILRTNALKLDPTGLANLTSQFPHAVESGFLNSHGQLGIAPNTNFRLRGSTGVEFVVQLPIIQAPFRVYYAYNVHRLHSQLLAPQDYIEPSEKAFLKSTFPDLWLNQIQPTLDRLQLNPGRINYFEPQRTFRFTVSRTF